MARRGAERPAGPRELLRRWDRAGDAGCARGGTAGLIVLDASAQVDFILRRPSDRRIGLALEDRDIRVPAHFDAEVFAAVRRAVRRRVVGVDRAGLALLRNVRLVAERVPLLPLYAEAFNVRDRFGPSDVFYAVLARSLSATLVTSDAALARAARGYVDVRYVAPA